MRIEEPLDVQPREQPRFDFRRGPDLNNLYHLDGAASAVYRTSMTRATATRYYYYYYATPITGRSWRRTR